MQSASGMGGGNLGSPNILNTVRGASAKICRLDYVFSSRLPSFRFRNSLRHDDDIKLKHFPFYWPFMRGIHRSPADPPHEIFRSYYGLKACPRKRSRSEVKCQGQRGQSKFCPNLGFSGPWLQFEFTDGYGMMHIVWSSIEDLPYCWSSANFQGHRRQNIFDFDSNWVFPDCNCSLNSPMVMHTTWSTLGEVPYCFSMSSAKVQDRSGQKIADFESNWAFPDCNLRLNSPMATKWCTQLEVR